MSRWRIDLTNDLDSEYTRRKAWECKEYLVHCPACVPQLARQLRRLKQRGINTTADLLACLPSLPLSLKKLGIELVSDLKVRQAVPLLCHLMEEKGVRSDSAWALRWMNTGRKRIVVCLLGHGRRELESSNPDIDWLEAAVHALGPSAEIRAVELQLAIFERTELPGWLRGEAADNLGCCDVIYDRRTRLLERSRNAILRGLYDKSIYVQFGSMYFLGSLAVDRRRRPADQLESALPRLRTIAARDRRLAPGFWWPMSAEARDVIYCIQNGHWPNLDAGDRFSSSGPRGEWRRD